MAGAAVHAALRAVAVMPVFSSAAMTHNVAATDGHFMEAASGVRPGPPIYLGAEGSVTIELTLHGYYSSQGETISQQEFLNRRR